MAGPRQPIALVQAKGKKHLTKAEIQERARQEVAPINDDLTPPPYLTAAEKKRFAKLAQQLDKLQILGETDVEALARYVSAQTMYEQAVKELRTLQKQRPKTDDAAAVIGWANALEIMDKRVDRFYKMAANAAAALGLTISSRCKLVAPVKQEAPKVNKFSKFGATS